MTTVEVITSVERRRRWSGEEKRRIVAESVQSERAVTQVARAQRDCTWSTFQLAASVAGGRACGARRRPAGGIGFVSQVAAQGMTTGASPDAF